MGVPRDMDDNELEGVAESRGRFEGGGLALELLALCGVSVREKGGDAEGVMSASLGGGTLNADPFVVLLFAMDDDMSFEIVAGDVVQGEGNERAKCETIQFNTPHFLIWKSTRGKNHVQHQNVIAFRRVGG